MSIINGIGNEYYIGDINYQCVGSTKYVTLW
jgi:hypothetical protein